MCLNGCVRVPGWMSLWWVNDLPWFSLSAELSTQTPWYPLSSISIREMTEGWRGRRWETEEMNIHRGKWTISSARMSIKEPIREEGNVWEQKKTETEKWTKGLLDSTLNVGWYVWQKAPCSEQKCLFNVTGSSSRMRHHLKWADLRQRWACLSDFSPFLVQHSQMCDVKTAKAASGDTCWVKKEKTPKPRTDHLEEKNKKQRYIEHHLEGKSETPSDVKQLFSDIWKTPY